MPLVGAALNARRTGTLVPAGQVSPLVGRRSGSAYRRRHLLATGRDSGGRSRAGHMADKGQDAIIDDVAMAWTDGKRLEPPSVIGRWNCFGVVGPTRATRQSVRVRPVNRTGRKLLPRSADIR